MRLSFILFFLQLWGSIKVSLSQNAQQCPVIHVDNNVQVIGDPEEATYGSVVRFSCKSNTEILIGSPEMYCDENGEWSGQRPKCDEIKCTVPIIENGDVPGDIQEYHEQDVLHFRCNPGYKPVEARLSKCTKRGLRAEWSPTPLCESITCKLKLPPLEGTRYERTSSSLFSAGDTVRVICGEKHYIVNQQNTSAVTTCKANGQWTIEPVCSEVMCSNNRPHSVSSWDVRWGQRITLGETKTYRCRTGYKRTGGATRATCSRDGWKPDPLCQAQQCPVIHVDNNVQVTGDPEEATYGSVVRFSCKSNTEILIGSPEMDCDENGEWNGQPPKCYGIKCTVPIIENGDVPGDIQEYDEQDVLHFRCNPGYKPVEARLSKCTKRGQRAEWSPTPLCEYITCKLKLPPLEGTRFEHTSSSLFSPGDTVTVICGEKHYIANPQDTTAVTTCKADGQWTIEPVCSEVRCSNNRPHSVSSWDVRWGQRITLGETKTYRCRTGYKKTGGATRATCSRDGWKPDPLCQAITCRTQYYQNADIDGFDQQEYRYNARVDYVCNPGYEGRFTLTCRETGWTGSPQCTRRLCKKLHIDNAQILGNEKETYMYDENAQYACKNNDERVFTITCGQSGWTGIQNCSAYCDKLEDVTMTFTAAQERYKDGDIIKYQCIRPDVEGNATCLNAKWNKSEECEAPLGCGKPPPLADGDTTETLRFQYGHGERVEYICQRLYTMEGEQYKTCFNGEWVGQMRCLRPCTVDQEAMSTHNIQFLHGTRDKLYLAHHDVIYFSCKGGRRHVGTVGMRQMCIDGVMHLPTCQ